MRKPEVLPMVTRIRMASLAIAFAIVPSLLVGAASAQKAMEDICCELAQCVGGWTYCRTIVMGEFTTLCYTGAPLECDQ